MTVIKEWIKLFINGDDLIEGFCKNPLHDCPIDSIGLDVMEKFLLTYPNNNLSEDENLHNFMQISQILIDETIQRLRHK